MDFHALLRPTERLRLRWLEPRDEAVFCALYGCPDTMRGIGAPLAPAEARERFSARLQMQQQALDILPQRVVSAREESIESLKWPWENTSAEQPNHCLRVVAELAVDTGVAGLFGLDCWDDDGHEWELGVMTLPNGRGHGYPTEVLSVLSARLLELGAHRITLRCKAENHAARRTAVRAGFRGYEVALPGGLQVYWSRTS